MSDIKWRRPIPFDLPPAQTYDGKWHSMTPPFLVEDRTGIDEYDMPTEPIVWLSEEHAGEGSYEGSWSVVAERVEAPSPLPADPSELQWLENDE